MVQGSKMLEECKPLCPCTSSKNQLRFSPIGTCRQYCRDDLPPSRSIDAPISRPASTIWIAVWVAEGCLGGSPFFLESSPPIPCVVFRMERRLLIRKIRALIGLVERSTLVPLFSCTVIATKSTSTPSFSIWSSSSGKASGAFCTATSKSNVRKILKMITC